MANSKFDGNYTYQSDPINSYFRIDKKYVYDHFENKTILALEIPETADFHCQVTAKDKNGQRDIWLRSYNITPKECAEIYNQSSARNNLQKLYEAEFPDINVAFGGFCFDHSRWPTYSNASKKPSFSICDIFANSRWFDHDIVIELCEKYGVPTIPIIYKGKGTEKEIRELLGGPSKIYKEEKVHSLYVKLPYESIDDKWTTTRKSVTIIESKAYVAVDYSKKEAAASAKEVEEDESIIQDISSTDFEELSSPLETQEEINEFINKNFADTRPEDRKVIPINGKTKGSLLSTDTSTKETQLMVLRGKIQEIFNEWKAYANNELMEMVKIKGRDSIKKEFIFVAGPSLQEKFLTHISSDTKLLEKYERMVKIFGEKTVKYEAQVICYKYVGIYLGL